MQHVALCRCNIARLCPARRRHNDAVECQHPGGCSWLRFARCACAHLSSHTTLLNMSLWSDADAVALGALHGCVHGPKIPKINGHCCRRRRRRHSPVRTRTAAIFREHAGPIKSFGAPSGAQAACVSASCGRTPVCHLITMNRGTQRPAGAGTVATLHALVHMATEHVIRVCC